MKKNTWFQGVSIMIVISLFYFGCNTGNQNTTVQNSNSNSPDSLKARGQYLVSVMGCNDCHTPKRMGANGPELDMDRQLSGYPDIFPIPDFDTNTIKKGQILISGEFSSFGGPWGTSFAANITSDSSTGIGKWTIDQFSRALREGKFNGDANGRMMLPPMPWQGFSALNDDDLGAIFSYLKSLKPVKNQVPAPIPLNQMKKS